MSRRTLRPTDPPTGPPEAAAGSAVPDARPDRAVDDELFGDLSEANNRWAGGWRRIVFPAIFFVYLLQTAHAVSVDVDGVAEVAGYVILVAFCVCYLAALPARWSGDDRRFWTLYAATFALMAAEALFAHQDAFVMAVFVVVL